MNADTFLDNFEVLSEAPGGIDRLRELILSLAVRGKLVAQDPHEPTIFDELEDINPNEVGEMLSSERQLETRLPSNWVYAGFRHIGRWVGGNGFPTDKQGGRNKEILFCKVSDMNLEPNSKYIFETVNSLDLTTAKEMRVTPHAVGTVIFPKIGGAIATNKRRLLVKPTVIDNNCMGVSPSSVINPEWLYVLFRSIDLTKYQSGTSIPSISQRVLDEIRFGVPPRAEQKRIVTKVDELMALCDQLEQQQKQRDNLRTATRKSAIDAISTAITPEELEAAWERINNNWKVIADTPESIDSIRNLINNLAVRGLLSKTEKDEKPIGVPILEGPFDLPPNWRWTRIGDVSNFVNGYAFPSGDYKEKGVGVVRMSDMKSGKIVTGRMKFVSEKYFDELSATIRVSPGDLVMGMTGATLGKPCFNLTSSTFLLNQRIGKFEPFAVDLKYLGIALLTLERLFMEVSFGTGVNNLSTKQIKESVFPIPPLEEQMRIVAKVDQLMTLCNQIEIELEARGEVAEKFARSVVNAA